MLRISFASLLCFVSYDQGPSEGVKQRELLSSRGKRSEDDDDDEEDEEKQPNESYEPPSRPVDEDRGTLPRKFVLHIYYDALHAL
jgi:hypothetical protein